MVVCPKCRSDRTAPILYGYPSYEAFEAEERGELILGGCEMIDGMPHEDYGCLDCRYRWSKELLPATQITKIRYKVVENGPCTIDSQQSWVYEISVSGNSMADDFSVYRSDEEKFFHETSLYIGQPLDNVYIHSKFEAERRVYDAMLEGLDAKVIRVGNLTNCVSDYKFQPNYTSNAFLTRVKAILEFGLFPDYLMNLYAEFSPIDKTAEGIIKIAQYADKQCVFHLNSNKVIYFERFLVMVHKLGISMDVVSGAEFNRALQETIKQSNTEYIFEAFQNDMDEKGRLVYDSNIRIKNEFTLWFLEKVGFEWNETDMEYNSGYIDYFRKIGYLEV